jgi:hypothetical protein
MPKRPFLVPTLRLMEASGELQTFFAARVRQQMGGV